MKGSVPFLFIVFVLGGSLSGLSIYSWMTSGWSDDLWLNLIICISLVGAALMHVKKVKEESGKESQKQ